MYAYSVTGVQPAAFSDRSLQLKKKIHSFLIKQKIPKIKLQKGCLHGAQWLEHLTDSSNTECADVIV